MAGVGYHSLFSIGRIVNRVVEMEEGEGLRRAVCFFLGLKSGVELLQREPVHFRMTPKSAESTLDVRKRVHLSKVTAKLPFLFEEWRFSAGSSHFFDVKMFRPKKVSLAVLAVAGALFVGSCHVEHQGYRWSAVE